MATSMTGLLYAKVRAATSPSPSPWAVKEQGKEGPGRVIAFSPWLDMENAGETLVTNKDTDALISRELLEGMIAGVLGDTVDPKTPLANPLYADFTGFPRLYITAGSGTSTRSWPDAPLWSMRSSRSSPPGPASDDASLYS